MATERSKGHGIMPHLIPKLDKSEFMHYKQAISSLHDIVVESGSVR
jgi:hypothetical protein